MKNKSKSVVDNKGASEQLIISEQAGRDMMKEKPPLDKKKLAALEKERKKAEKKLQEKLRKGESHASNTMEQRDNHGISFRNYISIISVIAAQNQYRGVEVNCKKRKALGMLKASFLDVLGVIIFPFFRRKIKNISPAKECKQKRLYFWAQLYHILFSSLFLMPTHVSKEHKL
nr:unnamed protein product [Callosobruchus chinensis]